MDKITMSDELAKAFKGLVGHFKKAATHHDGLYKAHDEISKVHSEHAAFHKGRAEAMDDGDAGKAACSKTGDFHAAAAAFHANKAALHKAHAAHNAEMADAYDVGDKAAGGAGGAGGAGASAASAAAIVGKVAGTESSEIEKGIGDTFNQLFAKALETVKGSDEIKKLVETTVADRVKEELKKMVTPTNVSAVVKDPKTELEKRGLHVVTRAGGATLDDVRSLEERADDLDPELRKAVV